MKEKKGKRVSATLKPNEVRDLARITRYVRGFCGPMSTGEVIRFLIRDFHNDK